MKLKEYTVKIKGKELKIKRNKDGFFVMPVPSRPGTALKPSVECWWMIRKPIEGGVAENYLKYGTGGINIDSSRIRLVNHLKEGLREVSRKTRESATWKDGSGFKNESNSLTGVPLTGRFPSHLLLSHHPECKLVGTKKTKGKEGGYSYVNKSFNVKGFVKKCKPKAPSNYGGETIDTYVCHPDCPVKIMDEQSGIISSGSGKNVRTKPSDGYAGGIQRAGIEQVVYGDTGGASRFFYCSKPSKVDKGVWEVRKTVYRLKKGVDKKILKEIKEYL